ncbi:MAG TPA: hypothetical protein VND70_03760 [Acidimicrobiales bacterium]|nr:hypothetical protein [Acidimicrobiales bacterium]
MSQPEKMPTQDPRAYVAQVMTEIEEDVRIRRSSGDLPPKLERELDELFLAHSPVAGRGGDLAEALRMVDAATFIDPVVPVDSQRAAGAFVKKGMRSLLLWYLGWITHQVSQFASAVSRTLHIIDGRLRELERKVDVQRVPEPEVVEFPAVHRPDAWWVEPAVGAVVGTRGRILHAASGDGWLVRRINEAGGDAYGVDPRPDVVERGTLGISDLRGEDLGDHLRATASAGLGAIVLSGVVDGMGSGQRQQLLALIDTHLAPGGTLVIHSVTRKSWDAADASFEADLSPGRPLRAETWCRLLELSGYQATVQSSPDGTDYLVTAVRASLSPPEPTLAQ